MDGQRVILPATMVTLGSTVGASMLPRKYGGRGELPSPRLLFGTTLTFAGLDIFSDFAPSIAGPIALSIAITALMYYGMPLLENYLLSDTPGYKYQEVPFNPSK